MRQQSRLIEAASRAELVSAGSKLLETYACLAQDGEHLFGRLLGGEVPRQWHHYPQEDAISSSSGFQWFYHSHSAADRPVATEHGHIHLFARRKLWSRRLRSRHQLEFGEFKGGVENSSTRHLLTIGFDAKGVPATMFTVNSWVTGDLMLSAALTSELLDGLRLNTGNPPVDTVLESLVALHRIEICDLLHERDMALSGWRGSNVLSDQRLEVLSEIQLDVDAKLRYFA